MDWQTAIKGIVAILALTGLGFYANATQYRALTGYHQRQPDPTFARDADRQDA